MEEKETRGEETRTIRPDLPRPARILFLVFGWRVVIFQPAGCGFGGRKCEHPPRSAPCPPLVLTSCLPNRFFLLERPTRTPIIISVAQFRPENVRDSLSPRPSSLTLASHGSPLLSLSPAETAPLSLSHCRAEITDQNHVQRICMGSEVETLEERLTSMLGQLQTECGILERMVYKNKNQHRRCSYFQYLMKVRRDLRLLQSAKLEELVDSCFLVITGKRPKQKVHFLESLKRRKCEGGKHNFMERLLGSARLLSQMVGPMLMAATEISILLARSFFMGFSLTILGLLARLRVLVQQILLDVVSVFNMVSSLSQKKQYIKINQEGIEVFREFYPTNEDFVTLDCVWKSDKFVLLERMLNSKTGSKDGDLKEDSSLGALTVKYRSIESFLGDDELVPERVDAGQMAEKGPSLVTEDKTDLLAGSSMESDNGKAVEGCTQVGDGSVVATIPSKKPLQEGDLLEDSKLSPSSNSLKPKSGSRKVAFVSVKNPPLSTTNVMASFKENDTNGGDKEDPFFSLLTSGNVKNSFF